MSKSQPVNGAAQTTPSTGDNRVAHAVLVVAWASLPFLGGSVLADALDARSGSVRAVAAALAWAAWTAGVLCTLVPCTVSLTGIRLVAPAALPVFAAATTAVDDAGLREAVTLATAAGAAVLALSPWIGHRFVNGSAYGAEERYLLRPPVAVLAGPLPAVWALVVTGATAGPLLLAARQWAWGTVLTGFGAAVAVLGVRAMHQLARRWIVLVPAGVVVHDPMALVDTLLVQTHDLDHLGPAPVDSDASDLTLGASGLAVELALRDAADVLPLAHQRGRLRSNDDTATTDTVLGRTLRVHKVLVTPTRPGALLRAARTRSLPVA